MCNLIMSKLNLMEGKLLIKIARNAIECAIDNKKFDFPNVSEKLREPAGVFVTLNERGELRGCIGFINAVKPMNKAIHDAAMKQKQAFILIPPRQDSYNLNQFCNNGAITIKIQENNH